MSVLTRTTLHGFSTLALMLLALATGSTQAQRRGEPRELAEAAAAVETCDLNAASSTDPTRPSTVLGRHISRIYPHRALEPCARAARDNPSEPRYAFQHCRALVALKRFQDAEAVCSAAAARGHAGAQYLLAHSILRGNLGRRNVNDAIVLLERASAGGYADAHSLLGELSYDGKYVSRNFPLALQHFTKASALGDDWATSMLAIMFNNGDGVERNLEKSVAIFSALLERMNHFKDTCDLELLRQVESNLRIAKVNVDRVDASGRRDPNASEREWQELRFRDKMRALIPYY